MKKIRLYFLDSPLLELFLRLVLGGTFIYASIHKIMEPASFAKVIYGYYLFPYSSINMIAITLPYIEFLCGIFLVAGIFPVSASLIITGMLASFIVAISINLIRGHEFDCGCFSIKNRGENASPVEILIRDVLFIALSLHIAFYKGKRKFALAVSCDKASLEES